MIKITSFGMKNNNNNTKNEPAIYKKSNRSFYKIVFPNGVNNYFKRNNYFCNHEHKKIE